METKPAIAVGSNWTNLAAADAALAGVNVSLLFRGTSAAASAEVILGGVQPAVGRIGIPLNDGDEVKGNAAAIWVSCRGGGSIVPTLL